ncbi:MAG: peptidase M22 [Chitinophagales bacterium]
MNLYLGIDTSAYTTSIALVDDSGDITADQRIVLKVEPGKIGLRQADAHFSHIRNLPFLFERVQEKLAGGTLQAIGASNQPRRSEESYMPVFTAGYSVAECVALALSIPLYAFSHQEGHIRAALYGIADLEMPFLAVHFSGGTSEILLVRGEENESPFKVEVILSTMDLNAGQLIDRVGVALRLPFPAGPALEQMARSGETDEAIPSMVDNRGISFSGAETRAIQLLQKGVPGETVAYLVFRSIANTLEKGLRMAVERTGVKNIVLAGGVMSNSIIKERLVKRFDGSDFKVRWARPDLSSDNATGIAMLARERYIKDKGL